MSLRNRFEATKTMGEKPLGTRLVAGVAALALALVVTACGAAPATDTGTGEGSGETAEQQATIAVTVEIDGSAGEVEPVTTEVDVPEGATAYDALVATGADVNASDSEYGMYVAGINGLASGDFGETSGWLYSVNGEEAQVACSEYTLAAGDVVTWTYVTTF